MAYGKNYFFLKGHLQGPADLFISYVLPAVIVIWLWHTQDTTPGKAAIGAIIVDARTGGAPSILQYVGRYLGYFVSMLPMLLGILWVGFNPKKQGWHDMLAGTVVVRSRNREPEPVKFG
jgi:uncharacterized RDD family membrane protein YckC